MKSKELKNKIKNEYKIVIITDSEFKEEVLEKLLYKHLISFEKIFDGKINILETYKKKKK